MYSLPITLSIWSLKELVLSKEYNEYVVVAKAEVISEWFFSSGAIPIQTKQFLFEIYSRNLL